MVCTSSCEHFPKHPYASAEDSGLPSNASSQAPRKRNSSILKHIEGAPSADIQTRARAVRVQLCKARAVQCHAVLCCAIPCCATLGVQSNTAAHALSQRTIVVRHPLDCHLILSKADASNLRSLRSPYVYDDSCLLESRKDRDVHHQQVPATQCECQPLIPR